MAKHLSECYLHVQIALRVVDMAPFPKSANPAMGLG